MSYQIVPNEVFVNVCEQTFNYQFNVANKLYPLTIRMITTGNSGTITITVNHDEIAKITQILSTLDQDFESFVSMLSEAICRWMVRWPYQPSGKDISEQLKKYVHYP